MMTEAPKRRRVLQFRLRALLIAIFVLSLPLSWLSVRMQRASRNRAVEAEVRRIEETILDIGGIPESEMHPKAESWLDRVLDDPGVWYVSRVTASFQFGDAGLDSVNRLADLRELDLGTSRVTDSGMEHLQGLAGLQVLRLPNTSITDAGLKCLQGMPNLRVLHLDETQVADAGLANLWGLVLQR